MPPHGHYGSTRGVRWDSETELFEMKCDDCSASGQQSYWPLTVEFWNPRTMQRCRACDYERRRRMERERRKSDPAFRQARLERAKAYYHANKPVVSLKHKEYMREYRKRLKGETAA